MNLNPKSLEKLRNLINEETQYRSGPVLVKFFKSLGLECAYDQEFPARWKFTDQCLHSLNESLILDDCIKSLFDPINFIDRLPELDAHIAEFNKYIVFDKYRVVRSGAQIDIQQLAEIELDAPVKGEIGVSSQGVLSQELKDMAIGLIDPEDGRMKAVIEHRLNEIERCFSSQAYLAAIILAGSTLEGVFCCIAKRHPRMFNSSRSSPKSSNGKVKSFGDWTLENFIEVAFDLDLIAEDMKRFSQTLREFRNYVHPGLQANSGFEPTQDTANVCLHVTRGVLNSLGRGCTKLESESCE